CHCGSVAVAPAEVSINTPVAALYEPVILPMVEPSLANASTSSPAWKPPVIPTVADTTVAPVTDTPLSTTTGVEAVLSPAMNEVEPAAVVTDGAPWSTRILVASVL